MTQSLFIKKSTVSGTIPSLTDITSSELAINLGDGTVYYRNVTSSLVEPINAGSASFAETASFALAGGDGGDGGGGFGGDFSGTFSGSVTGTFTGSLEATGTLTGTLIGSASFAENASTAVLAVSAVTAITASNANTASLLLGFIESASFATTASFALNAGDGGGETFNYFDVDAIPGGVATSSLNDEFTETTFNVKWQPLETGSIVVRLDGDSLLGLSTTETRGIVRRFAQLVPSGSWTMRTKVSYQDPFAAQGYIGLFIEASNHRMMHFTIGHKSIGAAPAKSLIEWINSGTFNSIVTEPSMGEEHETLWAYLEIEYDGVNIDYRTSWNGVSFTPLVSTRTTGSFLLGPPARLGLLFYKDTNSGSYSSSVDWFRIASQSANINGGLRTVG